MAPYKQWGKIQSAKNGASIKFPIAFSTTAYSVVVSDVSDNNDNIIGAFSAGDLTSTAFTLKGVGISTTVMSLWAYWIGVGK